MKLPNFKKKFVAGAAAAGLVMGAGGIAAAVFTASGSGPGAATVGTAPGGLTVMGTRLTPANGTLTPPATTGAPASTLGLVYKVTNNTAKAQIITTATATATITANTTGTITTYTSGNTVATCKASWFAVTFIEFMTTHLTSGSATTAYVEVSMPYSATTQNACSGARPQVTLTVPSHS